MEISIRAVATVYSDFPDKFGIPRQSGLVPELKARVVFSPEFRKESQGGFLSGISESGYAPGLGRVFPHLAHLVFFRQSGVVPHGAASALGREPANGGVCNPGALSP